MTLRNLNEVIGLFLTASIEDWLDLSSMATSQLRAVVRSICLGSIGKTSLSEAPVVKFYSVLDLLLLLLRFELVPIPSSWFYEIGGK